MGNAHGAKGVVDTVRERILRAEGNGGEKRAVVVRQRGQKRVGKGKPELQNVAGQIGAHALFHLQVVHGIAAHRDAYGTVIFRYAVFAGSAEHKGFHRAGDAVGGGNVQRRAGDEPQFFVAGFAVRRLKL